MENIIDMVLMCIQVVGNGYLDITFLVFVVTAFSVYMKFRTVEKLYYINNKKMGKRMLNALSIGVLGSILGSVIVMILGVNIQKLDVNATTMPSILIIIMGSVFLSLMNDRFIDFIYAASIVSIISLFSQQIELFVPGVMALGGVLHLVEAFLIWLDGATDASPVLLKSRDNTIIGGFSYCRAWPLPIIALVMLTTTVAPSDLFNMPDWWPVIRYAGIMAVGTAFTLIPVPTLIYYKNINISRTIEEHANDTAIKIALYGGTLIGLSVLAINIQILQFLLPILAVIGHEYISVGMGKQEMKQKPLFQNVDYGLRVLFCAEKSPGDLMGIESGDIVLKINETEINQEQDVISAMRSNRSVVEIKFQKRAGAVTTSQHINMSGVQSLGVMFIPRNISSIFPISTERMDVKKLIQELKDQLNDKDNDHEK